MTIDEEGQLAGRIAVWLNWEYQRGIERVPLEAVIAEFEGEDVTASDVRWAVHTLRVSEGMIRG